MTRLESIYQSIGGGRRAKMSAKKSGKLREVYQIKVTLLGTEPPIWRRLLVPADMTLVTYITWCKRPWGGMATTRTNL